MLGWALAQQGRLEEGLAQMQHGLVTWQATGARSVGPYFLALLAETYGRSGEAERGLDILADAVAAVDSTEERWWEAELYRLEGELLLIQHADKLDLPEIEACFRRALTIARQQQARTLELRATISLCRLWQRQGRVVEAHQVLTKIYGWFTQGWDTRDLQEAERLLNELNTFEDGSRSARDRTPEEFQSD
jgi:predicted ATPase